MTAENTRELRIGDGRDWHFVNGQWQDDTIEHLLPNQDNLQGNIYRSIRPIGSKRITLAAFGLDNGRKSGLSSEITLVEAVKM